MVVRVSTRRSDSLLQHGDSRMVSVRVRGLRSMLLGLFVRTFALCLASPALAHDPARLSWTERKCHLYAHSWEDALAWQSTAGLSSEFLERHEAFLASECTHVHDVCPRSPEEIEIADLLTMMSMSEGMASTFVPFSCPD